jgi:hypothetical protein
VVLEKLHLTPLDKSGARMAARRFAVPFNPTTYSIEGSVGWAEMPSRGLNAPRLRYTGGGGRTLTLELFYDVTEPIGGHRIADVRQETIKVTTLARKDKDLERPPAVVVEWGAAPLVDPDFPFIGVITSLSQEFLLFRADGTPVRARLRVSFKEFANPAVDQRKLDPEFTTRVVRRGDSLNSLAAELYGDPGAWRRIARANGIANPRTLPVGGRLAIPKRG